MTSALPPRLRLLARDRVGRLLWALGLTVPARAARDRLTIVTLHRVLPADAIAAYPLPQLAVTPEELAWIVALLTEHFTCETLSAACRRWGEGERPARPLLALTFDDGQLDNFVHARPVLERAGCPGTFFVAVDAVDGGGPLWHDRLGFGVLRALAADRASTLRLLAEIGADGAGDDRALAARAVARSKALPEAGRGALADAVERVAGAVARPPWDGIMSWAQLRELAAAGHEVGSHTLSHALLPGVGDAQLEREVAGSRERIRAELGVPCDSFCFPNGDHDARAVDAVRRAGYRQAVVATWGPNRRGADPLRLARCELQGRTSRNAAGRLAPEMVALRLSPIFARTRR